MQLSIEQLLAARHPQCGWQSDPLREAVSARVDDPANIDLAELCRAWADDEALAWGTKVQCFLIAWRACKEGGAAVSYPHHATRLPLEALRSLADQLDAL